MFHRVVPTEEMSDFGMRAFEITPEELRMVIEFFLSRGYDICSLDDLCDALTRNSAERKLIALTFDDGYKDTLSVAHPILKAYEAPFTVNVTWNYVERAAVKWDYLAEEIVRSHSEVIFDRPTGRMELDCSTQEKKRRSCDELQAALYQMADARSREHVEAFFGRYTRNIYDKTDELILDWPQIEEMARDPLVTIGAHSVNHYVLSRLDNSLATEEIRQSKAKLESRLGVEVRHFAYPYGRTHEAGPREFEIASQCGFRSGTTGMKGNLFEEHAGRLQALPRFCLGSNLRANHLSAIENGILPFLANKFRRIPASNPD